MKKQAVEVVVGDIILLGGVNREIKEVVHLRYEENSTDIRGVFVTFEELPGSSRMITFRPMQILEVVNDVADNRRRTLIAEGFEPTSIWRAIKDGKLLAETSRAKDFSDLGLINDPDVSFYRVYSRTERTLVEERPDA